MADIFPPNSRVCGYVRDSGGRDQELSTIQQRESIGKWCAEQGLILSRIFEDAARSGASTVGRNEFLEMVDYLGNDVPERGVILWELSRLSRDYNDSQYYLADLRRQGYIIHSLSDNLPPGLDGQMLESMKIWMNAKFLEDLKKNIRRGLHFVARTHHAAIGTVPIGYKTEQVTIGAHRDGSMHIISRLIIDEVTAPLVRRAFEMRAAGATYKEIHEQLHLYNWHLSYRRLFANMVYTGTKIYGGEVIEDFCPSIISIDVWQAVQKVQAERKARNGYNHPRALRSRFWLTGILFCSRCGKPMHGHMTHKKGEKAYDYYMCTSKVTFEPCDSKPISKDKLESRVIDVLRSIVQDSCILQDTFEEAQAQESAKDISRESALSTIAESMRNNEKQITHILSAIKETGHSQALLSELSSLEKHQMDLRQSMAQFETNFTISNDNGKVGGINLTIDDIIDNIQQALDITTDQERGIIIRGFVKRIEVQRDKEIAGRIYLNIMNMEKVIPL